MNGADLSPEELIHLQIELEYRLSPDGELIPYPGSSEQARFIIHWHGAGYMQFLRHDLPAVVRGKLADLSPEQAFRDRETVQEILESYRKATIFTGASCCFVTLSNEERSAGVSRLRDERGRAVLAIKEGGEVVSSCISVRENEASAEAWVYTEPEYRRRGYGEKVVRAWANDVMAQDKVAFYSYALDNEPSRRLAQKLALRRFTFVVAYD